MRLLVCFFFFFIPPFIEKFVCMFGIGVVSARYWRDLYGCWNNRSHTWLLYTRAGALKISLNFQWKRAWKCWGTEQQCVRSEIICDIFGNLGNWEILDVFLREFFLFSLSTSHYGKWTECHYDAIFMNFFSNEVVVLFSTENCLDWIYFRA